MIYNKYSKKCIDFVNTHFTNYVNVNITNNPDIPDIANFYKIFKNTYEKFTFVKKSMDLPKINDNKCALMFVLCKMIYESDKINVFNLPNETLTNTQSFYKWHNETSHSIDINKLSSYKSDNQEITNLIKLIFEQKNPRKKLHNLLYNNNFVSIDIQFFAESQNLIYESYIGDDFSIYVYKKNTDVININNIIHIWKFIKYISNVDTPFILTILYCPIKKLINSTADILTPMNANSGSTLAGSFVNIWRSEELEKVLFHELIHFSHMDIDSSENHEVNTYLMNKFMITKTSHDSSLESFTESLAILLHTIYMAYKMDNFKMIDELFKWEILFSLFQTSKILVFFNFNNFEEFLFNSDQIKINQTTSILSYYIVKSSIIYNINTFLEFLKNKTKYITFIKKQFEKSYVNKINNIMKYIIENKNKSFIWETMRMSCITLV